MAPAGVTETLAPLPVGEVYVPDVEAGFVLARVLGPSSDRFGPLVRVALPNGREVGVREADVHTPNPRETDRVPDMTQLTHLNAAALLHNARCRYEDDLIYTYTAYILLALNPYRSLSIYGRDAMERYRGRPMGALPPHVYALADRAYRAMKSEKQSQSILISGDSGAGKTETSKFVMQYLAYVGRAPGETEELGRRVLDSNPVLEAFGNAKTLRNNNSSRFGKFMKIFFSADGVIVGAGIDTYLLERSRVTQQDRGERNYHVFYQFCAGATEAERQLYRIGRAEDFAVLTQGGSTAISGVDDAADFRRMREAMARVGVGEEDQSRVLRTLASVLHLGNLRFGPAPGSGGESSVVENRADALSAAAELLEVPAEALEAGLCFRTVEAGGSAIRIALKPHEAAGSRNALARAIYQRLFDWLVARINSSLRMQSIVHNALHGDAMRAGAGEAPAAAYIGVLDIFGFEFFERNSFEQLCINYANERLQQHFNAQVFKQEADVYAREGLAVRRAEFADNADALTLVDKRPGGVFALLDEECRLPGGSDRALAGKIHARLASHARLLAPPPGARGAPSRTKDEAFVVRHYAADVTYEAAGFLEKNNDSLHSDLLALASSSPCPLMRALFPSASSAPSASSHAPEELAPSASGSSPPPSGSFLDRVSAFLFQPSPPTSPPSSPRGDPPASARSGPLPARFSSVCGKFSSQLDALMKEIGQTSSHFIRCIKPNNAQAPQRFEGGPVLGQLRASGMLEAVRMLHAGYPTRCTFDTLHQRYAGSVPAALGALGPARFAEALLIALDVPRADFKVGLTRVFFRSGKLGMVDQLTNGALGELSEGVAERVRRWLVRKRWTGALWAARTALRFALVARRARALAAFVACARLARAAVRAFLRPLRRLRRLRSALLLQSAWRAHAARARRGRAAGAARRLQAAWRGLVARRAYAALLPKQARALAATAPPSRRWTAGAAPGPRALLQALPPPLPGPSASSRAARPPLPPKLAAAAAAGDPAAAVIASLPPEVLALLAPRESAVDELRQEMEEQKRRYEEEMRRREAEAEALRARLEAEAEARRREREEERARLEAEMSRRLEEEMSRRFEEERRRRDEEAAQLRAMVEALRAGTASEREKSDAERREKEEEERRAREEEEARRRREADEAAEMRARVEEQERKIQEMMALLHRKSSVELAPAPAGLPPGLPKPASFRRVPSRESLAEEAAAAREQVESVGKRAGDNLEGLLDRIFSKSAAATERRRATTPRSGSATRRDPSPPSARARARARARGARPSWIRRPPAWSAPPARPAPPASRPPELSGGGGGGGGAAGGVVAADHPAVAAEPLQPIDAPRSPLSRRGGLTTSSHRVDVSIAGGSGGHERERPRAASARVLFPQPRDPDCVSPHLEPLCGTPPQSL
eukprot:tig00020816_g14119.t1